MAHEITAQDNIALAQTGAWHGIGNVLPDAMTPQEALVASGLDWQVEVVPQFFTVSGAFADDVPEEERVEENESVWESQYSRTVVRMPRPGVMDRDGKPEQFIELSSVGMEWTPIQNRSIFEMAEAALGAGLRIESAGSMQQGRKVFALLKGDSFRAGNGNDEVGKYLLLANGHDAQFTFRAIPTSIRVVCMNTLKMALQGKGQFALRHVGDTEGRLALMGTALQRFKETGDLFEDKVQIMARKEMNSKELAKYWKEAWRIVHGSDELPKAEDAVTEMKAEIESWTSAMEVERLQLEGETPVTAWLAANAVTGILQNGAPKRKTKNWKENRQVSNLFGDIDQMTTKLMQAALALA